MMLHDVCSWVHRAEECMIVLSRYNFFNYLYCLLALLDVDVELDIMEK